MSEDKQRELHPAEIAKAEAEARKADAEAEAARVTAEANAEKARAEARQAEAVADETKLRAKELELELVKVRHDADREEHKRSKELADNEHHRVYLFDKEVTESSVKACIAQLSVWERTSTEPITVELQLNSPGGSVVDGFALIDFITDLHRRGHTVNTTAYGMAASMAGVILQIGKRRSMGSNAVLLIHEASFGAVGSYGEVQDRIKLVDIFHEKILGLFTDRSKVSKAFIKRNWTRKDWWLSADTALKHGFIDDLG